MCVSLCQPTCSPENSMDLLLSYRYSLCSIFLKILNHMQSNPRSTSALPSQCVRVCISWQSYPTRTPIMCSASFLFFCFALHSSLSAKVSLVRLVFFYSCLSSLLKIKTAETKTRLKKINKKSKFPILELYRPSCLVRTEWSNCKLAGWRYINLLYRPLGTRGLRLFFFIWKCFHICFIVADGNHGSPYCTKMKMYM